MSTAILQNPTSLQREINTPGNDDIEDVQCDSLRIDQPVITDLHQCLIDIDEELGEEELEGFKFLCRDHIPVSKLDKAQTPLEIFDFMQKMVLIDEHNVDYLLECLGRVHRLDLVRKLGFEPDAVRCNLPYFEKLFPYRTLLMDITEDLDEPEAEKIRFFLRGKIRKKILNEKRSLLQLLIFMEQEGLLSPNKLDLLTKVMESIKRGDLIDKIRIFQGLQPLQRHKPGLNRNANPTVPSERETFIAPNSAVNERIPPPSGSSSGNSHIDRSVSAGTLSVNSEENEAPDRGTIPQSLFDEIVTELVPHVDVLGFELGISTSQQDLYDEFPDERQRTLKMLQDWQASTSDKGRIPSGLHFVLTRLGCKRAAPALKSWMDSLNAGQFPARQSSTDFEPQGPPDNHCASLREAQIEDLRAQIAQGMGNNHAPDLTQFRINPNQIPGQVDVNRLNGIAVYQQGDQYVANPGISRELPPMVVPLNNIVQGQGQSQTVGGQAPVVPNVNQVLRTVSQQISEKIPALPSYPMLRKPRGWCVIINNKEFHVVQGDNIGKEMPARNGTDKDAESLQHIFSKLGFVVRRRDNMSDTEMMTFLIDVAHNVDHSNFDCFVCCILTHGVLNYLYGSNGKLVSIKDLTETFQTNRCQTLAGKPKLFFLQACQGRDKMTGGTEFEQDGPTPVQQDTETDQVSRNLIPNEADFLLGYATVPGYVSFRSRNHGSWYIRKLCELLEKYSSKFDLMSILVEVNREVASANASMDNGMFKQIPAPLVTLRKQLYFR